MNYETINYCYLCGLLESELTTLAYDDKFLKMKNYDDRRDYVKAVIARANLKANEFEKMMSTR